MASLVQSSLLVFIVLLLLPINFASVSGLPRFDSIYQFGDSISDTGNLMRESPVSFCSFSPYGESLPDGKPTGRCSNGLLMIDFFEPSISHFLTLLSKKTPDFTHGINFAVAGATSLDATRYAGVAPTNSSLPVQLGWFRNHLKSVCPSSTSSSDCKKKFEKTLFMVGEVGGNDYNYALLTNQSMPDVLNLVPQVIQNIVSAVEEVISHGALQVVVPGNFPIGCMPIYLNNFRSNDTSLYDNLGCLKPLNEFAKVHNEYLQQTITKLQKQYSGVAIHYGDYYSAMTWVLRNAASLGFNKDRVFEECCGNATHACGSGKGAPLCPDPTKRISWDGVHLTQQAYNNMAHWLLSDMFPSHASSSPSSSPSPSPSHSMASGPNMISSLPFGAIMASILAFAAVGSKLI